MADDEDKGTIEKLQDKAAREVARRTLERGANRFLDELEEFLLGKKGAAEEILEQERERGSGLDRVRREYGIDPDADEGTDPREAERERRRKVEQERRERAEAELEAIKRRLAEQRGEPPPGDADGPASPEGPERSFDATDGDEPSPGRSRRERSKRSL